MARFQIYSLVLSLLGLSFSGALLAEATPFPTAVAERPFTLPSGMTEAAAKMKVAFNRNTNGDISTDDMLSLDGAQIGVGVTNDFQLGLAWRGFQIPKLNPSQALIFNAGYFLFAGKHAAGMADLTVPVTFDSSVVRNIVFAMPTSFGVTKHSSIMAFHYDLVNFGFANNKYSATFELPIRYAYQLNQNLWMGLGTSVAKFEVGTGNDHSYFWKKAPLTLQGLYAINNAFDIMAQAGFDNVYKAADTFSFGIGLAYRIGNLEG